MNTLSAGAHTRKFGHVFMRFCRINLHLSDEQIAEAHQYTKQTSHKFTLFFIVCRALSKENEYVTNLEQAAAEAVDVFIYFVILHFLFIY